MQLTLRQYLTSEINNKKTTKTKNHEKNNFKTISPINGKCAYVRICRRQAHT